MILILTFLVKPIILLYFKDHKGANLPTTYRVGLTIFLGSFIN